MKTTLWKLGVASGLIAAACGSIDSGVQHSSVAHGAQPSARAGGDDDGSDEDIAIADLPAAVRNAALAAVPGIVLTKAEKETEAGRVLYSVEGSADGVDYCVEVGTDGSLIGVEQDGGADADDEDADDDEDEDGDEDDDDDEDEDDDDEDGDGD